MHTTFKGKQDRIWENAYNEKQAGRVLEKEIGLKDILILRLPHAKGFEAIVLKQRV